MTSITKSEGFKNLIRFDTLATVIIYLLNVFLKSDALNYVLASLLVILFISGFMIMNKTNRIVVGCLAILGIVLLIVYKADLKIWVKAIISASGTISIIWFAAIISMPFFYKPYQSELKNVCDRYISSPAAFLLLSSFISYFLGFYMAMAAIPAVYALFGQTAKEYKCHRTFVMTICIGNALIIAAAPQQGAAVTTAALNMEYTPILIYGSILSIALIIVTSLINAGSAKKEGAVKREKKNVEIKWSSVGMLIFIFVLLCALILVVDNFTSLSLIAGICLLAFPFAIVFALLQKKTDIFKERLSNYWQKGCLANPNTMAIVGIGGFAGEGLKMVNAISDLFASLASHQELMLILPLLIMGIAVLTSLIGVHPAAMGSALAGILTPELLGMTPIVIAMIILCGWSISLAASPFSAVSNLASAQSGEPVFNYTASKSIKWVFGALILATVIIDIYQLLGI